MDKTASSPTSPESSGGLLAIPLGPKSVRYLGGLLAIPLGPKSVVFGPHAKLRRRWRRAPGSCRARVGRLFHPDVSAEPVGNSSPVIGACLALALLLAASACSDDAQDGPKGGEKDDVAAADVLVDAGAGDVPVVIDVPVVKDVFKWVGKCAAGAAACDDDNPCTVDGCDPNVGCSSTPRDCSDDDPCTLDTCILADGSCQHLAETCDDGNACTEGKCNADEGCVYTGKDCADGDACTSDGCSPQTGCLNNVLDCDDGIDCTADSCDAETGCQNIKPAGAKCCNLVGDCEDDNVCTLHTCTDGVCATAAVYGCCHQDADCDDGDDCTLDQCDKSGGVCANNFQANAACCMQDSECNDNDACTLDRCVVSKCAHEVQCCQTATGCLGGAPAEPCVQAECSDAGCAFSSTAATGCCEDKTAAKTGFEAGDKWTVKTVPSTKGSWQIDSAASVPQSTAKDGTGALAYGAAEVPIPGGHSAARAILGEVELPAATQVTLRFWVRALLIAGSSGDRLSLRAETSLGKWIIWQASGPLPGWKQEVIDLSGFAARPGTRKVRLVFELAPSKLKVATTKAWIDQIEVETTCAAGTCNADADCDDKLAATTGVCSNGACVYKTAKAYCESVSQCNDNDSCTVDQCTDLLCQHTEMPNCCTNNDQCLDENPCTTDYCSGLVCKHLIGANKAAPLCCFVGADCDDDNPCTLDTCPVVGLACAFTKTSPDCCIADVDCDDGDKCTLDECGKNKCSHKSQCCKADVDCDDGDNLCTTDKCTDSGICSWLPTGAVGCCDEQMVKMDLEDGGLGSLTLKNNSPATSKWQLVSGKKAKSGKWALYYGNLAKGNFDDQVTNGTVTLAPMEIPKGEKVELSFSLWMDTEGGTTYDKFEVSVVIGAKKYLIWNKQAPGFAVKAWGDFKVDLSAFGGQKGAIEFLFDTNDGVANTGEGVYLDDIALGRTCDPKTCNNSAECDDGLTLSTETCTDGKCSYVLK